MRSVCVAVVGSDSGSVLGARFERQAGGGLILCDLVPSAGADEDRSESWLRRLFGRSRPTPWLAALPSGVSALRRVVVPDLPAAKREKLLAFEMRQLLPGAAGEMSWAYALFPGEHGTPARAVIAAARIEAVQSAMAGHLAAGRRIERVEPRALAVYRAFRYNYPDEERVVALVDLGAGGLSVMLVESGSFAQRSCRVSSGDEAGTTPAWPVAGQASGRAMAGRIHLELARLLAIPEAVRPIVRRVLFVGSAADFAALAVPVSDRLGLALEQFDAFRRVVVKNGVSWSGCPSRMAEWVGLAALPSPHDLCLDLSPPAWREERERRKRRPRLYAAFAALLLAPVPPGCFGWVEGASEHAAIHRFRGEIEERAPLAAAVASRREEAFQVSSESGGWRDLEVARTRWIELLEDLRARASGGHRVWFESMQLVPAADSEAGVMGRRLRVAGRLEAASPGEAVRGSPRDRIEALFGSLRQAPWCEGVEHERFDPGAGGGFRFEAVLTLAEGSLP